MFEIMSLLLICFCTIFVICTVLILLLPFVVVATTAALKIKSKKKKRREEEGISIGFFHPYCNAGGGGERVLWVAINAVLARYPSTKIYVYTGDNGASAAEIINKAVRTFNVRLDGDQIQFVYLKTRNLVEGKKYSYFTLLLQSLGSMVLGFEALMKFNPDIYIDTMGYAFTMPIFKYFGLCKTATYTHYPTITDDMMRRVKMRVTAHNNSATIAKNPMFSYFKMVYYQIFGWLYGYMGRCADIVMVNGTWTEEHINKIWKIPLKTHRLYPPCDVSELKKIQSVVDENGLINIVSIGQFRPEKDHPLMLEVMFYLRDYLKNNEELWNRMRLIFVGSCRGEEDEERVTNLKDLAKHLSLENNVQFKVNVPFSEIIETFQNATIGLHAMWNEHFGIAVVESMAAGLIMVAHRSGGPLCDIIETSEGCQNGFLADRVQDYVKAIIEIVSMSSEERQKIREAARASVDRFSQKEFEKGFIRTIEPLMKF